MHSFDHMLWVYFYCDPKRQWIADSSKKDWYYFPSTLSSRQVKELSKMLHAMLNNLEKCSYKMGDTVCVHKGIDKNNIVMNSKGQFRFMHFSDVVVVDKRSKIGNVPAAEYSRMMVERLIKSVECQKGGSREAELELDQSLAKVADFAEAVVCIKYVPKFVKEFMDACKDRRTPYIVDEERQPLL